MEKNADNLKLWNSVEKTNPKYTKNANVQGNKITSISPQYQIMNVTETFGEYGKTWGWKSIDLDYSLVNTPFRREKTEGVYPNKKVVGLEEAVMGLVVFKGIFFYPGGEFPIINSISLFTNNDMTKIDDNFAKKIETDALTKAISKLGFNADIFMGKFDDVRYVEEMKKEFAEPTPQPATPPSAPKQDNVSLSLPTSENLSPEMAKIIKEIGDITVEAKVIEYVKKLTKEQQENTHIKNLANKRVLEIRKPKATT